MTNSNFTLNLVDSTRGMHGSDRWQRHTASTIDEPSGSGPEFTRRSHHHSSRLKRIRTSFQKVQLDLLHQCFKRTHKPSATELRQLAQQTGLSKRVLQVGAYFRRLLPFCLLFSFTKTQPIGLVSKSALQVVPANFANTTSRAECGDSRRHARGVIHNCHPDSDQ